VETSSSHKVTVPHQAHLTQLQKMQCNDVLIQGLNNPSNNGSAHHIFNALKVKLDCILAFQNDVHL